MILNEFDYSAKIFTKLKLLNRFSKKGFKGKKYL